MSTLLQTRSKNTSAQASSFTPGMKGLLQRKCTDGDCRNRMQRSRRAELSNPLVHEVLHSPGQPLDAGTRAFMEPRFGHDFSQVRVHTDARAQESAHAVKAIAYTVGRDIVFGDRQFAPSTYHGQMLIAHELTHVVQQKDHSRIQKYPDRRDSINQEATLTEARGRGENLRTGTLERMDVNTLMNMSDSQRYRWYLDKLGRYQNQIDESATNHNIPPQLLATVILNELADINVIDTLQESLGAGGSLGIAQIQVDTAIRERLAHMPGDEARLDQIAQGEWETEVLLSMDRRGHIPQSRASFRREAERQMVVSRLSIPQYAIEACAREVHILLNNMVSRRGNPWQSHFGMTLTDISQLSNPNDIYNYIDGSTQLAKEENLAEMITAAYNSPGIIDAVRQESITESSRGFIYSNARIHGNNSRSIAGDLFIMALFHSFSNVRRIIDIQPKSLLPEASDNYEKEADNVAEHIVQGKLLVDEIEGASEREADRNVNEVVNEESPVDMPRPVTSIAPALQRNCADGACESCAGGRRDFWVTAYFRRRANEATMTNLRHQINEAKAILSNCCLDLKFDFNWTLLRGPSVFQSGTARPQGSALGAWDYPADAEALGEGLTFSGSRGVPMLVVDEVTVFGGGVTMSPGFDVEYTGRNYFAVAVNQPNPNPNCNHIAHELWHVATNTGRHDPAEGAITACTGNNVSLTYCNALRAMVAP